MNLITFLKHELITQPQLIIEEMRVIVLAEKGILAPRDFAKVCKLFHKLPRENRNWKKHAYILTMIEPSWVLPEDRVFEL